MEIVGFHFTPSVKVRFTKKEITRLMWLSAHHYDGHCKSAGVVGGFLFGINNTFWRGRAPDYYHTLTWSQLDTLAKITEPITDHPKNMVALHLKFMGLLHEMNMQYEQHNPAEEVVKEGGCT